MTARDTSIDAYHDHDRSGELGRQQMKLLGAMRRGRDYSRSELSRLTRIRLTSVCGRVKELKDKGRITEAPVRACKVTGRTVHPVFKKPE